MGYSLTQVSIDRVKKFLEELIVSNKDVVWQTTEIKFAYYLREAIQAAKHLGQETYAKLEYKYKIRVRPGLVIAELREGRSAIPQDITTVVDNVRTLYEIVGAIVEHKGSKMQFPNAELSNEDLIKLSTYANRQNYIITKNPLTLTKTNE